MKLFFSLYQRKIKTPIDRYLIYRYQGNGQKKEEIIKKVVKVRHRISKKDFQKLRFKIFL
jgi:hypothetical protein